MIKLCNVGKTYTTKAKIKVDALKDVNLELGVNGMTFILGKSGSGKSTLLNLLGGLDKPTTGSITVDGADMQAFTQADYESYRNAYVGFVFQEYNLLDDFNVMNNVALALKLSKEADVNQKVVDALKQVGLDERYLDRRVGELSGGEKQRVAIARAIVKDSKMILADEPTGNLDSETGESIWNILKDLSQTRPIIIVSHDRESAEKYADRVIEISDGKVIADSGSVLERRDEKSERFTPKKSRLPILTCLKMGFNSLLKRKIRTVSVVIVSILTVCAMLITQLLLTYYPERSIAKHIRKYDTPYVTLAQGYEQYHDNLLVRHASVWAKGQLYKKRSTIHYLEQNAQTLEWGYIDSKQQLLDFGFEFVGDALELDDQSFYIGERELKEIMNYVEGMWQNLVIIDGKEESLFLCNLPIEQLVGHQVKCYKASNEYYTLAGIIKDVGIELPLFAKEKFEGRQYGSAANASVGKETYSQFNGANYYGSISFFNERGYVYVITNDGLLHNDGFSLNEDEILMNFSLYSQLFGGQIKNYVKKEDKYSYSLLQTPEKIGQTVTLKIFDTETNEQLKDVGELKIKGVVFSDLEEEFYSRIICSKQTSNAVYRVTNTNGVIVRTDTVKNINNFLLTLRKDYMGFIYDVGNINTTNAEMAGDEELGISPTIYEHESFRDYAAIMLIICAILAVVTILLMISLISFSISNRKKEIGILSALGTSSKDIVKIFLLETLIISVLILVLGMAGIFAIIGVINVIFSRILWLEYVLAIFVVDIYAILTLFGVCFVLLPLFALLPTIRIAKLKPIDAIRVL